VTGGGISSGLDEALKLIELLLGTEVAQSVQVVVGGISLLTGGFG